MLVEDAIETQTNGKKRNRQSPTKEKDIKSNIMVIKCNIFIKLGSQYQSWKKIYGWRRKLTFSSQRDSS